MELESSLLFLRLVIFNKKNALAPNQCTQSNNFFLETHSQIKFKDGSVKIVNILIACTG